MFNVNELINSAKGAYTCDLTITHSDRVSNILSRNKNIELFSLDQIIDYLDPTSSGQQELPIIVYQESDYAGDSRHINHFKKLLVNNNKDFSWFKCWWKFRSKNKYVHDLVAICPVEQEEKIYDILLRYESLKAFL